MMKKFEIVIGYSCNFRCKYCFEQCITGSYTKKKMSEPIIKQSCIYILNYLNTLSKEDKIRISFFGGENFLYIKEINSFINKLEKYQNIYFDLISNGSLIQKNQEQIFQWKELLGNRFSILISYDYSLQDQNRCKNTYQKVRNAIKWLDSKDISVRTNTIFMKNDLTLFHKVFSDYLNLQKELKHKFLFRIGMDNLNLCNSQYDKENTIKSFEAVKEFIKKNPQYAGKIIYKYGGDRYNSCGLGWRVANGIDVDGSLYPCQGAIYDEHKDWFYIGNVSDNFDTLIERRKEFFSRLRWPIQEECKTCTAWCKSCPLETIKTSVTEFGALPPDKDHCVIHKTISEYFKDVNSYRCNR